MTEENLLSNREEEILQLVATGLTNREIAQQLTISPNTVKVHLSNIFEKINVSSRTEATFYGIEHGIVDVPGGDTRSPETKQMSWRDWVRKYSLFWAALVALILLFFVTFSTNVLFPSPTPAPVAAVDAAERWQELAPMPEARSGMAAAAYNGDIYAVAGQGPDGISGSVFRYDPDSDTWESLRDKPTPVTDVEGVLIGEKIFVPGGLTADGIPTNVLEIYDPRQDRWTQGAPLPKPISAYALVDFEGKMYLFGGWDGERTLTDVFIYDGIEDFWYRGSDMDIARRDLGAVSLADSILIIGGRNEDNILKDVKKYFPSRDETGEEPWVSLQNLPQGRFGFGVVNLLNRIMVFGGNSTELYTFDGSTVDEVVGDSWQRFRIETVQIGSPIDVTQIGSSVFLFFNNNEDGDFEFWSYTAIYYEIFIPFVE